MDDLRGRVVLVTGGGGGIGAALAQEFATRGARLVLADLEDAAMAKVAEPLVARGVEVACVRTDVGDRASVAALADAAEARFGGGRGGHVVNTASMAGLVGMQWLGVYCASKFAVVGLSEALQRELAPHGIGVSVLCPMIVDTNINENSVRNRPATLRNPGEPIVPSPAAMVGSVIPPAEVARRVVRAVERNDFYVLTHPEQREILRRRAARLDRMFEPDRW
jgi:NAD(P)-dependent dehydrogenase (short-subunit alcohol dehydrogenase family)